MLTSAALRVAILFSLFLFPSLAITAPPAIPEVKTYEQLIFEIRAVRTRTQAIIEQAVEQAKVREAWETGKLIQEHILLNQPRGEYGKQVIERLASDLGTSERELNYMVEFAREYPIARTSAQLTWGHYESLLAVNDPQKREEIETLAAKENWPLQRLRQEIRARKLPVFDTTGVELPEITPGPLNTYQTFRQEGRLKIDLGFDAYLDLPKKYEKKVKEGEIVILDGSRNPKRATLNDLYTYQAKVTQVVDGDTFHALIDLGFGITLYQRLRLRRLDAPEIVSTEGKEAKEALEKILFRNKGQILAKISRTDDQYGRYLVDVWVDDKNIDRELLDAKVFTVRGDA